MKGLAAIFAVGIAAALFAQPAGAADQRLPRRDVESVSMVQLIANPDRYIGKYVVVQGYAAIEFELNALFLSADDLQHLNAMSGVWLNVGEADLRQHDGKYVMIHGVFSHGECNGHLCLFAGELEDLRVTPFK